MTTEPQSPPNEQKKDKENKGSFLDRLRSFLGKLADWFYRGLGVALWGLLIGTIFWWLLAVIIWPVLDARYNRVSISLEDPYGSLEVWGPRVVPGGAEPAEISFTLLQGSTKSEPITVIVTIPDDFVVQNSTNQLSEEVTLIFSGRTKDETESIQLLNANQSKSLFINQRTLDIKVLNAGNEEIAVASIDIGVEGSWRYILRTFGGISPDKMPLVPLATLIVAIGGFWLKQNEERYRLDKEKKEEESRLAEKKREEEQRQTEEIQKQIRESLQFIRTALKGGNVASAEQRLSSIGPVDFLTHEQKNDREKANQLIALTHGNFATDISLFLSEDWLEATAGVLIYAAENKPADRTAISAMLRSFPFEKLKDETTCQQLLTVKAALGSKDPPVSATWPPTPPQQKLEELLQKKGYKNPFLSDFAEGEIGLLFQKEKAHFWDGGSPSLYKKIKESTTTTLVIGQAGSGRTTLAMALGGYYEMQKPFLFSCYTPGAPSIAEIRLALVDRLIQFLEMNPHYLMLLGDGQKSLVAQILVHEMGKKLVLSRLEANSPLIKDTWLKDTEKDENKHKIWKAEAQTHFNLLMAAIKETDNHPLPDAVWLIALRHCVSALKFKDSFLLCIDLGQNFSWGWFSTVIEPHHDLWNKYGLHPILFTTPEACDVSKIKLPLSVHVETLGWQKEELEQMLAFRWKVVNGRVSLSEIFQNDAKEELLLRSNGSPRRLIRLWCEILVNRKAALPVSKAVVLKIAKELNG